MSGDDTYTTKAVRCYNKLLVAILEGKPDQYLNALLGEANFTFRNFEISMETAKKDAEKYYLHYQAGRAVLVLKSSPLGKILEKGKYVPG